MAPSTPSGRPDEPRRDPETGAYVFPSLPGFARALIRDPEFANEKFSATGAVLAGLLDEAVEAYRLSLLTKIAAIRPPDRFAAIGTWEQGFSEAAVLRLIEGEKPARKER